MNHDTRPRGTARLAVLVLAGVAGMAGCGGAGEVALSPPLVLAAGGASNPTAAVDLRDGTGYVTWVQTSGGEAEVLLARLPAGSAAPEPAVRVNDVAGDAAPHLQAPPRVAVGPEGHVYVVWQNNTVIPGRPFPASDLRFARSTDGGRSFEPALTVNDDASGPPASHTFHDLLVTPAGDVVVSWLDGRELGDGEGGPEETPAAPGGPMGHEGPGDDNRAPAAGGHGHHGGLPVGATLSGSHVRIAVSTDRGHTFGPSTVVDLESCPCCRTDLAVGPDGDLHVSWRKVFDGDVRDVVVARSGDRGATWSDPVPVHVDGWVFPGCPHAGPAIALDGEGALHAAWYTGKEEGPGLFYARSPDGGLTFEEPVALLDAPRAPPSQVDLQVGPDGRVWLAWEDRTDGGSASWLWTGAPAERPEPVVELDGTHPSLAAGGTVLVAWLRGDTVLVGQGEGAAPQEGLRAEPSRSLWTSPGGRP